MEHHLLWPLAAQASADTLSIGGCSLVELAETYGTPLYVLDEQTLRQTAQRFVSALGRYPGRSTVAYACKALLNTALAQLLLEENVTFDVVSLNELAIVRRAGADIANVHLHGNSTPRHELATAMQWGLGRIVVDNLDQLESVIELSAERATPQNILLRIAPDVKAGGNAKIQTGKATSKFGLNISDGAAMSAIQRAHACPTLTLLGLHAHAGSQIRSFEALQETLRRLLALAAEARAVCGWEIQELSPGGGMAVPIHPDQPFIHIDDYCAAIVEATVDTCAELDLPLPHLSIEPGRSMVARAGVAVYRVSGRKVLADGVDFLHVDGGIGDNVRPAMYGAVYDALRADRPMAPRTHTYQIAGRYCESGDILIPHVTLPETKPNQLIVLPAAGAYTLAMASNYNGIGRPTVLLARDGTARIMQRRETWQDIVLRDQALYAEG